VGYTKTEVIPVAKEKEQKKISPELQWCKEFASGLPKGSVWRARAYRILYIKASDAIKKKRMKELQAEMKKYNQLALFDKP